MKSQGARKLLRALTGWLAVVGSLAAGHYVMVRPNLRTKTYFYCYRAWYRHCPVKSAKDWPVVFDKLFEPFVPVWAEIEPGVTMWLDPEDLVSNFILTFGQWEPKTWQALKPYVREGGTFIDIGAHIGWYSLKAAKLVGPKGCVIAVEPNHDTLVTLRNNIRASGADRVIIVAPVACANSETTLTFYAAPRANTGESSLSLANASHLGPVTASYQVRARRLDDIVREVGVTRVDAVKIDVEGAEFLVLEGAAETLDRYRPVVSVEIIDGQLKSMGSSAQEVMDFMHSHGYSPLQTAEFNTVYVPAAAR